MYVVFLKITIFLWLTLILHTGHSSLFLETVRIEFMGPRGRGAEGPRADIWGRGPRKTNTRFNVKFSTYFHMKTKILADFQICISLPLMFIGYFLRQRHIQDGKIFEGLSKIMNYGLTHATVYPRK